MNEQEEIKLEAIQRERVFLFKEINIAKARIVELNIQRQNIIMR